MQIVERPNEWAEAFSNLGKGLTEGYQNRSDEIAIKKTLDKLDKNASPREIIDAIIGTPVYKQETKKNAINNILSLGKIEEQERSHKEAAALKDKAIEAQKQKADEDRKLKYEGLAQQNKIASDKNQREIQKIQNMAFLDEQNTGLRKEELGEKKRHHQKIEDLAEMKQEASVMAKEAERDLAERKFEETKRATAVKEELGKGRLQLAKDVQKFKESHDVFTDAVKKGLAKDYGELFSKIVPGLENMQGNMQELWDIYKKIPAYGFVHGAVGWKSSDQALLERKTMETLKPYIDLFADGGNISNAKFANLNDKFVVKATDRKAIAKAKLTGLEDFIRNALDLANKRMDLIEQYKGNVPKEMLKEVYKEQAELVDKSIAKIDEAYAMEEQGQELPDIPFDVVENKDRVIKASDGKFYKSNGMRWVQAKTKK